MGDDGERRMRGLRERGGNPLAAWITDQYGEGKQYQSLRHLAQAAGANPSTANSVEKYGRADPKTLIAFSRVTATPVPWLFHLAGWLSEEEATGKLRPVERQMLKVYLELSEEQRQAIDAVMRAMQRPASRPDESWRAGAWSHQEGPA